MPGNQRLSTSSGRLRTTFITSRSLARPRGELINLWRPQEQRCPSPRSREHDPRSCVCHGYTLESLRSALVATARVPDVISHVAASGCVPTRQQATFRLFTANWAFLKPTFEKCHCHYIDKAGLPWRNRLLRPDLGYGRLWVRIPGKAWSNPLLWTSHISKYGLYTCPHVTKLPAFMQAVGSDVTGTGNLTCPADWSAARDDSLLVPQSAESLSAPAIKLPGSRHTCLDGTGGKSIPRTAARIYVGDDAVEWCSPPREASRCVAAVAELLIFSHPRGRTGFNPRPGHSGIFASGNGAGDAAGRRVFLGLSRFPRPRIPPLFHSRLAPSHPSSRKAMVNHCDIILHSCLGRDAASTPAFDIRSENVRVLKVPTCLESSSTFEAEKCDSDKDDNATHMMSYTGLSKAAWTMSVATRWVVVARGKAKHEVCALKPTATPLSPNTPVCRPTPLHPQPANYPLALITRITIGACAAHSVRPAAYPDLC
ncbi:hypothetical protein PR048_015772 [Dryococelus australis]|uniref:Uncharacterized protein n=1 Tax=Dryococelus australis TaxID=614101 RepID=A0ABQ9HHW0_9NEOP|nr:hypothetical protein PR048_015772 [Dryococelus australis]